MASRSVGRSILAVVVGAVIGITLSVVTDFVMTQLGFYPPLGQPAGSGSLVVATCYRAVYGVLGSYVTARMAPARPMLHVMVLGCLGLVACIGGVVADWNGAMGPQWYPWALVVLALPQAWLGGWIRVRQVGAEG